MPLASLSLLLTAHAASTVSPASAGICSFVADLGSFPDAPKAGPPHPEIALKMS
jgi:hypothetical protein